MGPVTTNKVLPPAFPRVFTKGVPGQPVAPFDLQPRVYKTAPYSMLVGVPGPIIDDSMAKPAPATNRMPIIRPDLNFIPRR